MVLPAHTGLGVAEALTEVGGVLIVTTDVPLIATAAPPQAIVPDTE